MIQQQNQLDGCYPSEYFEDQQNLEHFECPIGLGIVKNPVFDQCGHIFCRSCITKCLEKKQLCPLNNNELNKDMLIPALSIKNIVSILQLKKCFNSCDWKGKIEEYEKHEQNECPNVIIKCSNAECPQNIFRRELESHVNNCYYTLEQCDTCEKFFERQQINDHLNECDFKEIQCKLCQNIIRKKELLDHEIKFCFQRQTICSIEGCEVQYAFKDAATHMNERNHIYILQSQIQGLNLKIMDQRNQIISLQNNLEQQSQPPYLQGWKLSHKKEQNSREWDTIVSINRVGSYFSVTYKVIGLQSRSNSWRAVIGVSSNPILKTSFWYKQPDVKIQFIYGQTYVYILGGLKCVGKGTPEPYGKELEGDFTLNMTLNRQCELTYSHNQNEYGQAFMIDKNIVEEGMYLVISLINLGKIKIIDFQKL